MNRRLLKLWWLVTGRLDAWPGDTEDGGDLVQTATLALAAIGAVAVIAVLVWLR